jgi:hypothetical protein
MGHAGIASFISTAPMVHALEPLRRFMRTASRPCRHRDTGRVYLGAGQSVVVMPAFQKGPESTAALRDQLGQAGFIAYDWGLGYDMGALRLNSCLRRLEEKVIDIFEADHQQVTLLGWGLTGIYAREVAKRASPLVRQVITLGSPINASADPKHRCALLRALEGAGDSTDAQMQQRLRQRPPVPCTSIFSRNDEVVPWQLSVETETAYSENVGVTSARHHDLPSDPRVLEVVTHRLSQPEEEWLPFTD